jgi:hypothetical protein
VWVLLHTETGLRRLARRGDAGGPVSQEQTQQRALDGARTLFDTDLAELRLGEVEEL